MEPDIQRDKIIEQLEALNEKMEKQISIKRTFLSGIMYGIGFFVGSAILATIALGILGPWFGEIQWVRETFERGSSMNK